jgi:hypothetical protein
MAALAPIIVLLILSDLGNHVADNFEGILYINGCPIASIVYPTKTILKLYTIKYLKQNPIS